MLLPGLLLLAATLSTPTRTLVLTSGARLAVDGDVTERDGRLVFRSGGALYSLASSEVDFDATRTGATTVEVRTERDRPHIRVSDAEKQRLLRDLEQNHNGTPSSPDAGKVPHDPSEYQTPLEKASGEEWTWRRGARAHEEEIRQAKENLQLLRDKASRLRSQIAGFLSQGYKPNQFTYQAAELQATLEALPQAELAVERAERAFAEFRDDARRLDVTPGWLR
jgi:hypothetical protein